MRPRPPGRPCARTIDRPITILGLEPEEFVGIGLVSGAVLFLVDAVPAVLLGLGATFLLHRLKAGKPSGDLFYLFYRSGLARFLPRSLRAPHLLRPPLPGRPRRIRLSPASSEEPDDVVRYYRPDRPHVDDPRS